MVVSKDFLAQYGAQSSEARVGTSSTTGHSQHGPMNPSTGPPTNMQRTSSLLAESMNDPISVPHSNNLSSFFNELEMELGLDQDSIPAERENTRVPKRSAVDCLMHSWIQERIAPDFLPFNENAWVCVHELVEKRTEELLEARALQSRSINQSSSAHSINSRVNVEWKKWDLLELELERVKYIMKAYIMARLKKIEEYASWLQSSHESKEIAESFLLLEEQEYAAQFAKISQNHLVSTISDLPPKLRIVYDRDMESIIRPDMETPVFAKVVTSDAGQIRVNEDLSLQMENNDIFLIRYRFIKQLLMEGKVQLL